MKRSGFKRTPPPRCTWPTVGTVAPLARGVPAVIGAPVVLEKPQTWRSQALRDAINGMACVACGIEDGTIVGAHANQGKGGAIKASDATLMALCYTCHFDMDQAGKWNKENRRQLEYEYNAKTLRAMLESGKLKVAA